MQFRLQTCFVTSREKAISYSVQLLSSNENWQYRWT